MTHQHTKQPTDGVQKRMQHESRRNNRKLAGKATRGKSTHILIGRLPATTAVRAVGDITTEQIRHATHMLQSHQDEAERPTRLAIKI